jgi:uncharacterized protein (DUF1697 family)
MSQERAFAAFLRGINVGGHRVGGDELRSVFEDLGFTDVATFRASGNIIFRAADEPAGRMGARVEAALHDALGYEVRVFLRSAAQVRAIAAREPFPPELVEASKGKLQVSMLEKKPARGVQEDVLALATDEDRLAFGDRELFWLPSGGILDSELDSQTIERLLGTTTMRTMGTVEQIAAKYFGAREP